MVKEHNFYKENNLLTPWRNFLFNNVAAKTPYYDVPPTQSNPFVNGNFRSSIWLIREHMLLEFGRCVPYCFSKLCSKQKQPTPNLYLPQLPKHITINKGGSHLNKWVPFLENDIPAQPAKRAAETRSHAKEGRMRNRRGILPVWRQEIAAVKGLTWICVGVFNQHNHA